MSALLAGAGDRIDELKQLTRELNLHVPPSSFASKVSQVPYEQALAPMLAADTGPLHLYVGVPLCEEHCRFCMYFYGLADASGADAEECVASMETFLAALAGSVERPVAGMYVGTPSRSADCWQRSTALSSSNPTANRLSRCRPAHSARRRLVPSPRAGCIG